MAPAEMRSLAGAGPQALKGRFELLESIRNVSAMSASENARLQRADLVYTNSRPQMHALKTNRFFRSGHTLTNSIPAFFTSRALAPYFPPFRVSLPMSRVSMVLCGGGRFFVEGRPASDDWAFLPRGWLRTRGRHRRPAADASHGRAARPAGGAGDRQCSGGLQGVLRGGWCRPGQCGGFRERGKGDAQAGARCAGQGDLAAR